MRLDFDAPIYGSDWHLMCVPASDDRQYITDLKVRILPETRVYRDTDGFGNRVMYGHNEEPHSSFSVRVEGTAYTGIHAYEATGNFADTVIFRNPSALTKPGEELKRYLSQFFFCRKEGKIESEIKTEQSVDESNKSGVKLLGKDSQQIQRLKSEKASDERNAFTNYDRAVAMMEQLHADMVYTPGATTIDTTAEEALKLRRGVCQDYAHILIALCRMEKIPARYVVGMMEGEGASHAWVEVFSDGLWYGIDPTNLGFVVDDYVKISHGRDYRDCVVNKGKFYGGARQKQTVSVTVT